MQNDIARQLIDPLTGQLKSFDRWKLDIKGMTDHYVHSWLQTEYDTAVIRAHQAADWKHFIDEADVLPNVRWMPTTSITPDPLHQHYWEKRLTLPVNHPFWQEHRPGDRWNCKCSLQQTDEPVNASTAGRLRFRSPASTITRPTTGGCSATRTRTSQKPILEPSRPSTT